jgi:hypothetical protein
MSGNITPAMIAQMEANAHYQAAGQQSGSTYGLPYGPSDSISNNTDFNINFSSMTINQIVALVQKMFKQGPNFDPGNFNTQLDMYALIRNIGAEWRSMSPTDQAKFIGPNGVLSATLGPNGSPVLQAIAIDLITSIVGGVYYSTNPPSQSAAQAMLSSLQSDLSNLVGQGATFLQPFLNAANGFNLNAFISQQPNGFNQADFMEEQAFQFEADYSMNGYSTYVTNKMTSDWINDLLAGVTNPGMALMILISCVLISQNGDFQTQIGGKANETNALTNALITPTNGIQTAWNNNAGHFTWDSARAFYAQLAAIEAIVGNGSTLAGDQRFQSDQASVNALYNDFNDPNGMSATVPIVVNGYTCQIPIGALYQSAMTGLPIPAGKFGLFSNYQVTMLDGKENSFSTLLNSLSIPTAAGGGQPGSGSIVNPSVTQITTNIQNVLNATSAQSNAVTTAVQSLQQVIDKFETLIVSILQDWLNFEKTTTSAQLNG